MTFPAASLGTSGLSISRVGFGAWAVGGGGSRFGWGSQEDDDSVRAIRHAVDRGVNWVDTAAFYGYGHSEEVVGRALKEMGNDRPLVFTKCGLRWDDNGDPHNRMAPDSVREECEASLRRLGVDVIDLYQVHWPPTDGTPLEEYWAVMAELRDSGKVRAIGLSNHDVKQLEQAEQVAHVDSLQPPFSLVSRDAAADLIPWCQENGTGVIVYSPMQSGLLSGAMTQERIDNLPDDDWRKSNPDFTGEGGRRNLALAEALRPVADRHDVSCAAVAVAWTLAWRGVTGAIVGARTPEQVDGWIDGADLALTARDLDELTEAVKRTGAGSGPADPRTTAHS
ncbi:MAG TPA: aldo/keto reductase [Frankiaceae bacterium]|jgi:aryl-alcohol dehydrogenase-like predicted oxidoreductase|nr:aldo/keto reductase [Frankiaceae bacterium]